MPNYTECLDLIYEGVVAKPDADISGPGVIFAFIISACLTLLAIAVAYASGLVDAGLLGPVDRLVIGVPTRGSRHPSLHVTLRKAIMACSDQQIVTGIAILGAGFYRLQHGHISVYHFHVVIYLAWMSSSVHLSALTILKPYMRQHRGVMVWRCIGMLVLLVMMLIALVPTVSNDWAVITLNSGNIDVLPEKTVFGVPAICFWHQTFGDGVNPDAVLSYSVLIVSYLWKLGGLFDIVGSSWQRYVRNPLDFCLEMPLSFFARRYYKHGSMVFLLLYWLSLMVFLEAIAILEVLDSFSAGLWLSTLGLIYGIFQIGIPRQLVQDAVPSLAEGESEFGFGQLVPLILLVQPLGAVSEHMWLRVKDDEAVYHDNEPQNDVTKYFCKRAVLPPVRNLSLLHYAATYTVPKVTQTSEDRIRLHAILYGSKLFKLVIWSIHLAVAVTASVLFWWDYQTIGWDVSFNYEVIIFCCCAYAACALVVILLIVPFSRLGRRQSGRRTTGELPLASEQATPLQQTNSTTSWAVDPESSWHAKAPLASSEVKSVEVSSQRRSWEITRAD